MKSSDIKIAVVGPLSLQNQLLVFFIQEKTETSCFLCENAHDSFVENGVDPNVLELILFDCQGLNREAVLDFFGTQLRREMVHKYFILFNLGAEVTVEKEALAHGVRGFLYQNDCADTLLKAINAVLAGEVWISRKKLTECLMSRAPSNPTRLPDLTKREVDILFCLIKGYSNQMISDNLCISPHTVKTHLSNIFKKINVRNRRHAVHWANKNL
ncbi:putative csgAB operon transcriptional regulatory protein [Anaerolineales bacterium]|nr:putative csgAB operon transcriptional regulatory protein [Anaerolineales bacterium]